MAVTQRNKIKSSNITNAAYNNETKVLSVEFVAGNIYDYADVEQEDAEKFFSVIDAAAEGSGGSASPGAYFARNIRNKFKTTKVANGIERFPHS